MKHISAIIITKHEELAIAEAVRHAQLFASEVVVVDNDSKDDTAHQARKAGARVICVPGLDFSYLRNIGKEQAKGRWLLYIDTDERLSQALIDELLSLPEDPPYKAYKIQRENFFFGKKWPTSDMMVRLIQKDALIGWQGTVHESALVSGDAGTLHAPMIHRTHRDISAMVKKTNEWSEIEAQLRYNNHHPPMTWWRFFRVMFTAFFQSYIRDGGWKVGTVGVVESMYQACSIFITYAKLWEKQHRSKAPYDHASSS